MNKNDCIIRLETPNDYNKTENLIRDAFWNVYRPGCYEHYVLHRLRESGDFIPSLNFVMEKDGKIIGQNVFVSASINADNGKDIPIMAMGPICIARQFQRKGFGKYLLDYTLHKAKEFGAKAVCFEGNIDFYGKSGFTYASSFGLRYSGLPENADSSFFLCKELAPGYLDGISGEYTPPKIYFVDDAEVERFDARFPYKEKLVLPGQLV